jgi:hypothetical protein
MILLAHIDPVAIVAALGVVFVANAVSLAAFVGAVLSRFRRRWVIVLGSTGFAVGAFVAVLAVKDGAIRDWSWWSVALFAPVILSSASIARWFAVKPKNA